MAIGHFGLVSQTHLNFTLPEGYQLFVGDLEVTQCVSGLTIKRPLADIGQPQSWSGSFSLSTPAVSSLLTESLDDLVNPQRWSRGMYPVTFFLMGLKVATLRIIEYSYDEDTDSAEVELGDLLSLLDFRTPAEDYSTNFTPCAAVNLSELVAVALKAAGVDDFNLAVSGTIPVPPDKPSGSWIQWAQSFLGERGYWLYCDQEECIRVEKYPENPQPIAAFSRTQVETYERQRTLDFAPDKMTVVGVGESIDSCCGTVEEEPEISESFGSLVAGEEGNQLIGRTTSRLVKKANITGEQLSEYSMSEIRTVKTEQALGVVFPETEEGNGTLYTTSLLTEIKRYNREGFLVEEKYSTDKLLGICLPDAFPGDTMLIPDAEVTKITYSETIPGISIQSGLGGGVSGKPKPGQAGSGVLSYKLTETWTVMAEGTKATKLEGEGSMPQNRVNWRKVKNSEIKEKWRTPKAPDSAIGSSGVAADCTCDSARYSKEVSKRAQRVVSAKTVKVQGKAYKEDEDYYIIGGLLSSTKDSSSQSNTSFPSWARLEAPCPVRQVPLSESTSFAPKDFSPFRERDSTFQCSTLNTKAEAKYLSQLLGNLAQQRRLQRLVSMPIPEVFVRNPKPFICLDIHEGRYVCDAPAIVIAEDGAEISWTCNLVGTIPTVPRPQRLPVWIPTEDEIGGGLTALPYAEPVVTPLGSDFYLPVLGAGGTSPYNYIFSGIPPGMVIAGNTTATDPLLDIPPILIGNPTTAGTYVVTVTVTDFCGVSATSNVTVEVLPAPEPEQVFVTKNVSETVARVSGEVSFVTASSNIDMGLIISSAFISGDLESSHRTVISPFRVGAVTSNRRARGFGHFKVDGLSNSFTSISTAKVSAET